MAVATITLESSNGDSVVAPMVVSAPTDDIYLRDDFIVLDVDPKGMYDTGFSMRTQSGAFQPGGRPVGEEVPIRTPILPFWMTPESRPRFQKLWGTPYNLRKVKCTWNGPSGPRFLYLKLAKEILYTTEDGFDADIDEVYHAVVSAHAYNPMYESAEDVSDFVNPGNFTVYNAGSSGTYKLGYVHGETVDTTASLPVDASIATIQSALEALPSLGPGNVTVSGTSKQFTVLTPKTCPGMLTVDGGGWRRWRSPSLWARCRTRSPSVARPPRRSRLSRQRPRFGKPLSSCRTSGPAGCRSRAPSLATSCLSPVARWPGS
ncbi:hypothetical protein R2362_09650 [Mycobacteroides chelonae]|nr:hypothetical protein [Mycobacteroides chelonae]